MKTMILRSAAALMTAAFLLLSLTGCGNRGNSGGLHGGLEVSLDHAYASEKLNIDGLSSLNSALNLGDRLLISGMDESYNNVLYLYDFSDKSAQSVEFRFPNTLGEQADALVDDSFIDSQGNLNVIFTGYTWTTGEDGEQDYAPIPKTLEIYDRNMQVLDTITLDLGLPEGSSINRVAANPAGGFFISVNDQNGNQTLGMYDKSLRQTGEVKGNFHNVTDIFLTTGGAVYISYEDADWHQMFAKVDPASGNTSAVRIDGIPQWYSDCLPSMDERYDLYLFDATALYGISFQAGTCTEVVNWLNSDFLGSNVSNVQQLADGRFLLTNAPMKEGAEPEPWILTERDPDAFRNVTMITMAALGLPDELAEAVLQFNRTHDDARIAVANYEKYSDDGDYERALKKLQTDMTSGIVADLICTSGLPYESLANKGIFEDLSGYISIYSDEEYFTNLFDSMRYGGKLYHLGFSYDVQTIEGKKEFVGDKQGLSNMAFMDMVNALPADMAPFGDTTKREVLDFFVTGDIKSYTNVATGMSNFDTPEFTATLEFCNRFPDKSSADREMDQADLEKYWDESQYQYINNKSAMRSCCYSSVRSVYRNRFMYFGDAEVSCVGYPVSGESGGNGGRFMVYNTVAMSSNSAVKDKCWEFMRYMFSDEYQNGLSWSLPIKKSAFDKLVAQAMKPDTYIDENGEEVEIPDTIYRGSEEIELPKMPQSFADDLKAYIEGIRTCSYYDVQIYNIINEETQMFFSGDQNAKHTAEMIQSRVSLYLSEQS